MIEGALRIGFGQIPNLSPQRRRANVAVGGSGTANELGRTFRGWCEKLGIVVLFAAELLMVGPIFLLARAVHEK
jgi:hypothetical protein